VTLPLTIPLLGIGWDDLLFLAFAAVMIGAALLVVSMRDIIRCGLAMMVSFGALAGLYVIAGTPVVAAAQVLVYIGAISVLILFAIMLTQAGDANLPAPFQRQAPVAAVVALAIVFLVGWAIVQTDWQNASVIIAVDLNKLAAAIFNDYALPFEIVAFLLLAAIIGAIYLARRPEEDERAN
jgi:NADH-quinone oxidoreductase subunit J